MQISLHVYLSLSLSPSFFHSLYLFLTLSTSLSLTLLFAVFLSCSLFLCPPPLLPIPAVFPVWAGPGWDRDWSWPLCIKWEAGEGLQSWGLESPVWCMLCRGGREKLEQACRRGRGALRLPTAMLQLKLPRLFNIHQIPKVGFRSRGLGVV